MPRIEPVLHNWSSDADARIRIHVFDTGSIALSRLVAFDGHFRSDRIEATVPAYVVEHPDHGLVVVNAGLGSVPEQAWYVELAAPPTRPENSGLEQQMAAAGLDPAAVGWVILSDLHFDHTGGAEAFAAATVVVDRREREAARTDEGFPPRRTKAAYDDIRKWNEAALDDGAYATFPASEDLFGDGSVVLVALPGHSEGSIGVVVRAAAPVLLAGNAVYFESSWRYVRPPRFAADGDAWWLSAWRIKKFYDLVPELIVVPGLEVPTRVGERPDFFVRHPRTQEDSGVGS